MNTDPADWLSRTLKEEKERKRDKAFALWLACHTQEEIAEAVDMTQRAISEWEDDFRKKLEVDIFLNSPDFDPPIYNVWTDDFAEKSAADKSAFPADFEVPIYNVWKQQTKTAGGFYE